LDAVEFPLRAHLLQRRRGAGNRGAALRCARASGSGDVMSVDTATVKRVAGLARIAIDDAQAEKLVPELNNILGWIEQLGEVDTSGVAPMTAVIPNTLRLRQDVVNADPLTGGNVRDAVLANAPGAEHGFFTVPKVIE
jgi:aspartyl-tRNA(Asn)/glutamyl-tRNA(Gln) amidotransferase subunit C